MFISCLVNEDLSEIDEKDDLKFILTEEEYKLKTFIWGDLYKDWTDDLKTKKEGGEKKGKDLKR